MKLKKIHIHNYRSIIDQSFELNDYNLLVGANNAGKSTVINAIRTFYEKIKFNKKNDFPKVGSSNSESWIEITYSLNEEEFENLPEYYKSSDKTLIVRKLLESKDSKRFNSNQSNLYAVIDGILDEKLFFGAKNVGNAKLGDVIYIPAVSSASDSLKMSGPSPLRDTINFLFKEVVSNHPSYQTLTTAFKDFNSFANQEDGVFDSIVRPFNEDINDWGISFKLKINPISIEEITKNLISSHFSDGNISDEEFNIDQYGHGFQRSVIFNFIKLSSSFKKEKKAKKKEFNPKLNILLFEEPEAFLHPTQQDQLAYNLKILSQQEDWQVVLTSHASLFIGKATNELNQIIKINKQDGLSYLYQPSKLELEDFFKYNVTFKNLLDGILTDEDNEEIISQEEKFRYQLWLDSERASMFFANHVIITEGATEKILIEYLLDNEWADLKKEKLYVLDAMGKYNIHRYMKLLSLFGIKHSVIIDSDSQKKGKGLELHKKLNRHICDCRTFYTTCDPHLIEPDLESFFGLPIPHKDRKPLEMLKAITNKSIEEYKINEFKEIIVKQLDPLQENQESEQELSSIEVL
ncbi:AAA family ATPase [Priestia aryabhattai]|uniref:ATP-dependent nuclease n=1 Tax=Priestia aryabhattai TaxID=412384 RepID=UPI001ECC3EB7|nr:AAA family ATPase [Priestia aryabhattai]MBY0091420.1 AAA family ATPase [Priestia aryabhattai]MBY0102325.1 AAA family ATPase [Priestia aryabhattai]